MYYFKIPKYIFPFWTSVLLSVVLFYSFFVAPMKLIYEKRPKENELMPQQCVQYPDKVIIVQPRVSKSTHVRTPIPLFPSEKKT